VDPGWILLKGLSAASELLLNRFDCGCTDTGFSIFIPASRNSPIAFCRSSTLPNDPRRTRLEVSFSKPSLPLHL
jgi:hypothetical protein